MNEEYSEELKICQNKKFNSEISALKFKSNSQFEIHTK